MHFSVAKSEPNAHVTAAHIRVAAFRCVSMTYRFSNLKSGQL